MFLQLNKKNIYKSNKAGREIIIADNKSNNLISLVN